MTYSDLKADLKHAQKYLDVLEPEGDFTFQTFSDDARNKMPHLTRIVHGKLDEHFELLSKLNSDGAGVFVAINRTDLLGRGKANITSVRSIFVDLDGAPIQPLIEFLRIKSFNDILAQYFVLSEAKQSLSINFDTSSANSLYINFELNF